MQKNKPALFLNGELVGDVDNLTINFHHTHGKFHADFKQQQDELDKSIGVESIVITTVKRTHVDVINEQFTKEVNFILNGQKRSLKLARSHIDYDDLTILAGYEIGRAPDIIWRGKVDHTNPVSGWINGDLKKGQTLVITEGMSINVASTSNA